MALDIEVSHRSAWQALSWCRVANKITALVAAAYRLEQGCALAQLGWLVWCWFDTRSFFDTPGLGVQQKHILRLHPLLLDARGRHDDRVADFD